MLKSLTMPMVCARTVIMPKVGPRRLLFVLMVIESFTPKEFAKTATSVPITR